MELSFFKDMLFDLINESFTGIREIRVDDRKNLMWVEMGNGSVFRIHCEKER